TRLLRVPRHGHFLHVLGTPRLDERNLGDRFGVRQPQAETLARTLTTGLHAGLLREHDRDAVAERATETANQRLIEALAVRQQHHDRDDAPGDAQHRKACANTIPHQADERLAD